MLDSRKLLAGRFVLIALLVFAFAPAAHASYRAAFYYPWYPETWTVNSQHVSGGDSIQVGDGFHPIAGFYSSVDPTVIDYQIRMLDRAGIDVAISSWWGPGSTTDERFGRLMTRTQALGSPLRWALYYEPEGYGDPTVAQLQADLTYIWNSHAWRRMYARVNDKPVLFVYNADDTNCTVVDRWRQANQGLGFFLVLKVFPGYQACSSQPNGPRQPGSWHQYSPAVRTDHQPGHSFSISPGFWRADEPYPRLNRDLSTWDDAVRAMVASGEPWQLVTTWNEWGEGTAVEAAREWVTKYCIFGSTLCSGQYVNILHRDGRPPGS
jgi:glycosyl hydrolase family 99